MLETNDNAILEKGREDVNSREQEERQPMDNLNEEMQVTKEAMKIETSELNEEVIEKITLFLRGKGLSEKLVKTLIDTDLTDEHVRLLKTLNFDDDDIENLLDLWRVKVKNDKSNDSINSAISDDSSSDPRLSQDGLYLKKVLSKPLIEALREIVAKKPADPVEYLGHRLLHFKVCEERSIRRKEKELEFLIKREKLRLQQEVVGEEPFPVKREEDEKPGEDWNYFDYGE